MSSEPYSRDFRGYGPNPPNPHWPNQARVAVSFVLNLEEGAELAISDGDSCNEGVYEIVLETQNVPDVAMESHFEYGSRVGFWRILKLFDDFGIQATMNACGRAILTFGLPPESKLLDIGNGLSLRLDDKRLFVSEYRYCKMSS
ncbi:polysaccharide deacetylase family protein [Leptothoe spongobia]|uniref:Uncharacterized protein n=1 Tax=Leptothoe spongobia TAU-MAC 1115 TaxID=1967444 RepID=A0A947GKW2_9CYAN|nr:hypothetical protein [Leptothoe spongobia]MBT9316872.1 hypothetical protein [Leptothoe spongobia TAU-MAC 1115]